MGPATSGSKEVSRSSSPVASTGPEAFSELSRRATEFGIEKRTDVGLLEQNRSLFFNLLPDYSNNP